MTELRIRGGRDRLVVHSPPAFEAERRYVLDVVLSEWLGFDYDLSFRDEPEVSLTVAGDHRHRRLSLPDLFFATPQEAWFSEKSMPIPPLRHLLSGEVLGAHFSADEQTGGLSWVQPLPVLFGKPRAAGHARKDPSTELAVDVDVFGSVFFLLTRYEEVVQSVRDQHGRFPAIASLGAGQRFLNRPIADEYVDLLWNTMRALWPGLERRETTFKLCLTHDVDDAWAAYGHNARTIAHAVAGDLVRRRDPRLGVHRIRAAFDALAGRVDRDPYNTFDFLMDTSERHGVKSTFYIMAGNAPGEMDGGYRLSDPPVMDLLRRIQGRGHVLGLHASYDSYLSADRIRVEFDALRVACRALGFDQQTWGVRQHFLRFDNPLTWRNQDAAGLHHDSTIGFADQLGFRAGTCREYPVFDLLDRRTLALRERPLLVMDATLFQYQGLGLDEARSRIHAIVDACRRQRGEAVILYHNSSLVGPRERAHYRELVEELAH